MHTAEQSRQHLRVNPQTVAGPVWGLLAARPVKVRPVQANPFACDGADTMRVPAGEWVLRSDPIPWPSADTPTDATSGSVIRARGWCVPAGGPDDPFRDTARTSAPPPTEDTP